MKRMVDSRTGKQFEVLTAKELAERLGVSVRTVDRWAARGMPRIKQGYFSWYPWVESHRWVVEHNPGVFVPSNRYYLS